MLDLRRLVHLRKVARETAPARAGGATVAAAEPVRLIAITDENADSNSLRQIASDFRWRISVAATSDVAIRMLHEQATPLVICDYDLTGEHWRDVLAKIAALPQAVCVLVASGVVDDYLRRQVIRYHGYDLVSKPFQPEELRRAVTFAWTWRGWAHRHSEVLGKPTATGFHLFSRKVSVSHAFAHIVDFGTPVELGGLKISPGDLVHGDRHGVLTIPDRLLQESRRWPRNWTGRNAA